MGKDTDTELERMTLSETTGNELRGRQSIRATFKLTSACIEAISIVAKHLGIKQKSLFDHLAEDTEALTTIAQETRDFRLTSEDRVQKTFVISRRSLHSIESISRHFNAPRDALVEYSVQRLFPIIAAEREKHEKRKDILHLLRNHVAVGRSLQGKMAAELGEEDPLFQWMNATMNYYQNALSQMTEFVEKGKIIEAFDPQSLRQIIHPD